MLSVCVLSPFSCGTTADKMPPLCWITCENENASRAEESALPFAGFWTFTWLMCTLLILGLCANVYLISMTNRRRFSVRWDTFRLILRYTSVVDISLCIILASVVLRSTFLSFTEIRLDPLSVQCSSIDLDRLLYAGGIVVASGVVVAVRQTIMLLAFDQEVMLLQQNRRRIAQLVKVIAVVGVVCFVTTMTLSRIAPAVDQPLCYVTWSMLSRPSHLILVPMSVIVILGIFDIVFRQSSIDLEDVQQVDDSRWTRFVISAHVALITWFIFAAAMTAAGVLVQPVNVDVVIMLTSCVVLTSVWSALAVAIHWA